MSDPLDGSLFSGAEATAARIEQQIAQAQETARRAELMKTEFEAIRGRATSPRGEVTATVETSGRLTALRLTDDAVRLDAEALSALILSTAAQAQQEAAARSLALVSDTFGEDSAVTANLRDELGRIAPQERGDGLRWN